MERAAADAFADQREVGLGEQFEQLGRGAARRISITRSVIATTSSTAPSASRVALPRVARDLPLEDARDVARHDLAPVGPFARREAEDVGQAVVADVPALGEPGLDLAARRRTAPAPARG